MILPSIILGLIITLPITLAVISSLNTDNIENKLQEDKPKFKKVINKYKPSEIADEFLSRITNSQLYFNIDNGCSRVFIGIQRSFYMQTTNKINFQLNIDHIDNIIDKGYKILIKKDIKPKHIYFNLRESYEENTFNEDLVKLKSFLETKLAEYKSDIKENIENEMAVYKATFNKIVSDEKKIITDRLKTIVDSNKLLTDVETLTDIKDFGVINISDNKGIYESKYNLRNEIYNDNYILKFVYIVYPRKAERQQIIISFSPFDKNFINCIDTICEIKDYLIAEYGYKYNISMNFNTDDMYYIIAEK